MIALDTNVLIRFLVRDDPIQAKRVYTRFKQAEAGREAFFVPLLVVLEIIWVLESAYDKSRSEILDALDALKDMPILKFESAEILYALLTEGHKGHTDLSDLLIALTAKSKGCTEALTFDRKAAKSNFFRLLN